MSNTACLETKCSSLLITPTALCSVGKWKTNVELCRKVYLKTKCWITSYKTGAFDHPKFWDWCRKMSENNLVFVSEYKAPDDFICVWEGEIKTNFASQRDEATHKAVEKLFKFSPTNVQ